MEPQSITLMKFDPASLATGYRTSKVVGGTVANGANEAGGTIDDLIVMPNEKMPFAVLSVGGFPGMGRRYVPVPFSSLQVKDKRMVFAGAAKDSLKALPDYHYDIGTRLNIGTRTPPAHGGARPVHSPITCVERPRRRIPNRPIDSYPTVLER